MKKYLFFALSIILSLNLVGCFFQKEEEKNIDDVTIEKEEVPDVTEEKKNTDEVWDADEGRPEEYMEPDLDEPMADYGDQENPIICVFTNLWELEKTPENVPLGQLKTDMDMYLLYYFPNIDKQYNVSVVKGSEIVDNAFYMFKVKVEGINADGSDLEVKCKWDYIPKGEIGHYNFFSDLSPNGTEIITDKDGNPITYD